MVDLGLLIIFWSGWATIGLGMGLLGAKGFFQAQWPHMGKGFLIGGGLLVFSSGMILIGSQNRLFFFVGVVLVLALSFVFVLHLKMRREQKQDSSKEDLEPIWWQDFELQFRQEYSRIHRSR